MNQQRAAKIVHKAKRFRTREIYMYEGMFKFQHDWNLKLNVYLLAGPELEYLKQTPKRTRKAAFAKGTKGKICFQGYTRARTI